MLADEAMSDRQIFIGNLCNISIELLRSYCENYGSLTELSFNRDKENNVYHCFAFVTFQYSRNTSQFMSNRPHQINGEEVFVKRALPRSTSSIPERLIVTNRLVLHDFYQHDKHHLRNYFQKLGSIKKFDLDKGFIDYEDYDDVDRILLARPHYIRDKEISVTKFIPSDYHDHSDSRSHHHHSRHSNKTDRLVITTSTENAKYCLDRTRISSHSSRNLSNRTSTPTDDEEDTSEDIEDGECVTDQYEQLKEKFEQFKQTKELELFSLKLDLERTKKQLADLTQEKLDILIKNQQTYHNELLLRLCPIESNEQPTKKRKLSTSTIHREYEYYS